MQVGIFKEDKELFCYCEVIHFDLRNDASVEIQHRVGGKDMMTSAFRGYEWDEIKIMQCK